MPAAHRIFALVVDGVGADVAVGLEQRGQLVAADPLAGFQAGDELADAERGQRALGRGVGGGQDELRLLRRALQPVERGEPLGHDP